MVGCEIGFGDLHQASLVRFDLGMIVHAFGLKVWLVPNHLVKLAHAGTNTSAQVADHLLGKIGKRTGAFFDVITGDGQAIEHHLGIEPRVHPVHFFAKARFGSLIGGFAEAISIIGGLRFFWLRFRFCLRF